MNSIKKRSNCPLSCSLDILGDKWSLLIIRDLMFNNKNTYGEFLKSAEGIATNILASRLQILEENNIIQKLDHPSSKAKILYKLTDKGIELLPIIVEFFIWSHKYMLIPNELKILIKEGEKNKTEFIKSKTKQLKKANKT